MALIAGGIDVGAAVSRMSARSLPAFLSDDFSQIRGAVGVFVNNRCLDKDERPDIVRQSDKQKSWEEAQS